MVIKLNNLYSDELSSDQSEYFPENHGIIISSFPIEVPLNDYLINKIHCEGITDTYTTFWCPPLTKRNQPMRPPIPGRPTPVPHSIQTTRISSFSYIHKDFLTTVDQGDALGPTIFMIYDNTNISNISEDKLFAMYPAPQLEFNERCYPEVYCLSGAIGACNNGGFNDTCTKGCRTMTGSKGSSPCDNFNKFKQATRSNLPTQEYDRFRAELIIKSWNYNSKSKISDKGIMYDKTSGTWVSQQPDGAPWGWNDVSFLSRNKNIPIKAFGIAVDNKNNPGSMQSILDLYGILAFNLDTSFNEYRKNSNPQIPLMLYRIGLDRSCLTTSGCINPFFDLVDILPHWLPSDDCAKEGFPCSEDSRCCADPTAKGRGTGACYKVKNCNEILPIN